MQRGKRDTGFGYSKVPSCRVLCFPQSNAICLLVRIDSCLLFRLRLLLPLMNLFFIYSFTHPSPPSNQWHRKTQHSSNSIQRAPTSKPSSRPHRRHNTTSHKLKKGFLSTNNRSQPPPEESSLCSPSPCPEKPSTPGSPERFPRRWNSSTRSSARRIFRPSWSPFRPICRRRSRSRGGWRSWWSTWGAWRK